MEYQELEKKIKDLEGRLQHVADRLDLPQLQEKILALEAKQASPGFWNNQEEAAGVSQELARLKEEVNFVEQGKISLAEHAQLLPMTREEKDETVATDMAAQLDALEKKIADKERELRFDGPYDKNAAIMTIQAGAGGTDAQDWAEMLERMYMRYAEGRGWQVVSLDRAPGEEAGIKSSTFEIRGPFAFGFMREEAGVHRLVRLSPFNSDNLRQTSFARVEMIPKLEAEETPEIDEKDLEIDTFRAGGAGGQHVNKTSSAVRIRHIPTGIVVKCQNERSQGQNKAQAMSVLAARLAILTQEQHVASVKELKGEHKEAAWGNQIRSYVLHPYTMVKDHRTKVETSDAQGVLEGDLAKFIV
ncbi:MAG: peptide chain release factor 2 [Candidatus Andersenbacteria bacterium]|nr:peptide chain release factor 2 [Candidatus Andersenbacteria bacterium]